MSEQHMALEGQTLEHFSVDLPKERARRQYEQYGEREATQGKSLKNALLLVDGSSYLYRAWHAMPDLRGPNAEPAGDAGRTGAADRTDPRGGARARLAALDDRSGRSGRCDWDARAQCRTCRHARHYFDRR